jgi:chorismate synthase
MIRYFTAGESHGPGLTGIVEGVPAGLEITEDYIAQHLVRRQKGYGRGGRMAFEKDHAEIQAGVRFSKTTGAPIALYDQPGVSKKMTTTGPKLWPKKAIEVMLKKLHCPGPAMPIL